MEIHSGQFHRAKEIKNKYYMSFPFIRGYEGVHQVSYKRQYTALPYISLRKLNLRFALLVFTLSGSVVGDKR